MYTSFAFSSSFFLFWNERERKRKWILSLKWKTSKHLKTLFFLSFFLSYILLKCSSALVWAIATLWESLLNKIILSFFLSFFLSYSLAIGLPVMSLSWLFLFSFFSSSCFLNNSISPLVGALILETNLSFFLLLSFFLSSFSSSSSGDEKRNEYFGIVFNDWGPLPVVTEGKIN